MKRKTRILMILVLVFIILNINILLFFVVVPSITGNVVSMNNKQEAKIDVIATANQEQSQNSSSGIVDYITNFFSGSSSSSNKKSSGGGGGSSGSGSGGSGSGGGGCSDTCQSLGYECGTWNICGSQENCGGCFEGGICSIGKCEIEVVGNAKIYIKPTENNVGNGQESSIEVKVDTQDEIYAVQFELIFDKDIIEVLDVEGGIFLNSDGATTYPVIDTNNQGKIVFANTRFNTQLGVSGEGSLAIIILRAKSLGSSDLNLQNVKISNPQLQMIDVSLSDGNLVVI